MNWVDYTILGIVLLSTALGLWKGFLRTVLGLVGTIVSLVIAYFLAQYTANALLNWGWCNNLILGETGSLAAAVGGNEGLAKGIFVIIVMVIMFIILRLILLLLNKLIKKLTKKKGIGGIDRFLGLVVGLARGVLIVMVILAISSFIAPSIPAFERAITESAIGRHFYSWVQVILPSIMG